MARKAGKDRFKQVWYEDNVREMNCAKQVERHVSSSTEMYADRANGASNRKRSLRDRLGGLNDPVYTAPQSTAKR
jgi:hypothetical protein